MTDAASDHLYVNLSASAVRRRLKGHGFGVRRIEAAGKGRTLIVHTATGKHLRQLEALFQGALGNAGAAGQADQSLMPSDSVRTQRRPPRWNLVALCTPFAGYVCCAGVADAGEGHLWSGNYWSYGLPWFIGSWAFVCVFGLVAVGLALSRKERLWGLTAFVFVLNSILPLLLLYIAAAGLLGRIQSHNRGQ